MKHILLISILIFSSFLVSCEKKSRVLYLWETPSGGVWKSIGDDDTQLKYNGEIKHGKPDGVGVMEHPVIGNYVGEFKDGKRNGQGTETFPLVSKFVGEWKDGEKHGQGTETWSDGRKYEGVFYYGKKHGQATYTLPNGQKSVEEWRLGRHHGQGTYTLPNGQKYEGGRKYGKYWNVTFPDGMKYVGEYKTVDVRNGRWYDKDGNIFYKVVNGVEQ